MSIDNLEFVEMNAPDDITPIVIDSEAHSAEIAHYCNFDLLVKDYRRYINWNIEILEIRKVYRLKRIVRYSVNEKQKIKEIFLDTIILK